MRPFYLQPLLSFKSDDLLEFDESLKAQDRSVCCVEGYGLNLYVGSSDGTVEWWLNEGPAHAARHTLFPKRPVSKMYILPRVSKMLVISDGTLHALHLPNLEPVHSSTFPLMRNVVSVILNDDELDWNPGTEEKTDTTVVLVRRKVLSIYKLGARLQSIKEIPLPGAAPTHHALFQTFLCCALPSAETSELLNCVIDLSDASLTGVLPVSQISPEREESINPNIIVIPGEEEFLVTSFTGTSTMGVFLNGQGDPTDVIAVESGWIISLLSNQTITIHSLSDLDKPTQTISFPPNTIVKSLSYSPYGIRVKDYAAANCMRVSKAKFLTNTLVPQPHLSPEKSSKRREEPSSGSGLTPPSSPSLNLTQVPSNESPFVTCLSETLLVTSTSISSLIPTPPALVLANMLEENQFNEAIAYVDDFRRRLRRGELPQTSSFDPPSSHTFRYLCLLLASHLTAAASFQKSIEYWIRAKVDPRWILRLYEKLRGKMIGRDEEGEVQHGLKELWEGMQSIEDTITTSIKRNYSPHLTPSSELSPASTDLREALEHEANLMLLEVLRRTRTSRKKGGGARGIDSRKIDAVIDTTLAKLLTLTLPTSTGQPQDSTDELLQLLSDPSQVVLAEVEPFLSKRPYVLARVMRSEGKSQRVLELLRGMVEKGESDALCDDPIEELAQILESVKDKDVWQEYLLWLVPRRPERSLSLIITHCPSDLPPTDLLPNLFTLSSTVYRAYLEHIVVTKRSPVRALHQELLTLLLDDAEQMIQDDGVQYHLQELNDEYKKEPLGVREKEPFIHFLARIAPDTPIKRTRLKLVFLLQGSPFYEAKEAENRLQAIMGLEWERAIVYGKLAKHTDALRLLALDIQDPLSALTYATSLGEVLPCRLARSVASVSNVDETLNSWATLGETGRKSYNDRAGVTGANEGRGLVRDLLSVYMSDGTASSLHFASSLLNTHSHLLPLLPLLSFMPSSWSLRDVSPYFIRKLRKGEERRWEGMIKKSLGRGECVEWNLKWLEDVRKMPPVIRRSHEGSQSEKGEWDEKHIMVEDEKEQWSTTEKIQMTHDLSEKTQVPQHHFSEKLLIERTNTDNKRFDAI
ncbi:uncharacterized protein L203_103419 [Cryptococcus depauperatus CBS 7841]|uniref:CNH domain-containing protein n=1 Tax=Cryptococcus depauperatus CBS 7841 TaxID=1295531 RepID=A0AAJ8JTH9_9TREE